MKYTKSIYFKDGSSKTITDEEAKKIKDLLLQGNDWISVQGAFISKDTIARIDDHHATADIKKWNESDLDRKLIGAGRSDLVEARRQIVKDKTMNAHRTEDEMMKKLIAGDPEAIRYYNNQPDKEEKEQKYID